MRQGINLLFTIHGKLLTWNECGDMDVIVYHWPKETFPFWISYKNGGDLARFKTWSEVNEWIKKHIVIPNI